MPWNFIIKNLTAGPLVLWNVWSQLTKAARLWGLPFHLACLPKFSKSLILWDILSIRGCNRCDGCESCEGFWKGVQPPLFGYCLLDYHLLLLVNYCVCYWRAAEPRQGQGGALKQYWNGWYYQSYQQRYYSGYSHGYSDGQNITSITHTHMDVVRNAINDVKLGRDARQENIKLSHNPHEDILIKADKGRTGQVISNLLSNAIEFTAKGNILVSVEVL